MHLTIKFLASISIGLNQLLYLKFTFLISQRFSCLQHVLNAL